MKKIKVKQHSVNAWLNEVEYKTNNLAVGTININGYSGISVPQCILIKKSVYEVGQIIELEYEDSLRSNGEPLFIKATYEVESYDDVANQLVRKERELSFKYQNN